MIIRIWVARNISVWLLDFLSSLAISRCFKKVILCPADGIKNLKWKFLLWPFSIQPFSVLHELASWESHSDIEMLYTNENDQIWMNSLWNRESWPDGYQLYNNVQLKRADVHFTMMTIRGLQFRRLGFWNLDFNKK